MSEQSRAAHRPRVDREALEASDRAFDDELRRRGVARQRLLVVEAWALTLFNALLCVQHAGLVVQLGTPEPLVALLLAPLPLVGLVLAVLGVREADSRLWQALAMLSVPVNLVYLVYVAANAVLYVLL